jgi:hypothetical protein
MAEPSAACADIYNKMKTMYETLSKALKLHTAANRAIKKIVDNKVSAAVGSIPFPDTSNPDGGILNMLQDMISCPFIADSATGSDIADAINDIQSGDGASVASMQRIRNGIKQTLISSVEDAKKKTVYGKLDKMTNSVDKALYKSGAKQMLTQFNVLTECVYAACDSSSEIIGEAETMYDSVQGTCDDANIDSETGDVKDVSDNSNLTEADKIRIDTEKQEFDALQSLIDAF